MSAFLNYFKGIAILCASIALVCIGAPQTQAQTASSTNSTAAQLQTKIDQNNQQIQQLNTEITQYQTQLNTVSAKKQTLQGTISQLSLSIKKTTASVSVTKTQINTTQLQIDQLQQGITTAQNTIQTEQAGLSESLRQLQQADGIPLPLVLLSETGGLADAWADVSNGARIRGAINDHIANLANQKQTLTTTKTAQQSKQNDLVQQQKTLLAQQGSLTATKNAQNDLLTQTKSQESAYQAIIAQKQSQEASLQQALNDLKSQYNQAINPDQITAPGQGILAWPIGGKISITQYFGDTPYAQAHAALYSGHGHDGLDIAAPIGTPVHAALSGTIFATGNTDLIRGCYSFGKWVMIKHDNGLNTMYAHLSQINVSAGEPISTGDVIGYSGETGYATGPHLHFGVYVSSVTKIIPLGQATNGTSPCSHAIMPVPPVSGYLNPLNYLPAL